MRRPRILSPLVLALAAASAVSAPDPGANAAAGTAEDQQGVAITSQVQGTTSGGTAVNLTLSGLAAHTQTGLNVLFTTKQLLQVNAGTSPISASLDTSRASTGTLSSTTFPALHKQDFFLRLKSNTLGTLVSDLPLTVSATIDSSPPTATYTSTSGNVAFYREGDPNKQPVLTVQSVKSSVKPAASQTVNINSLVTATLGTATATVQFTGSASNLLSGTNVLFTAKQLTAVNPGPLGPTTVALDSREPSSGTLSSETFPTDHTQNFFLKIQSANFGTLVADRPVTLTARIQRCPPTATYQSVGTPVAFYRQGDPSKQTVLTVQGVTSDVTPGGETQTASK